MRTNKPRIPGKINAKEITHIGYEPEEYVMIDMLSKDKKYKKEDLEKKNAAQLLDIFERETGKKIDHT